ncbi:MAG TPA: MerR family transcriptional regulator [Aggregatilineales bacterium]|nr:MerR family transcriptional regulator [Aggregatilineales bacterium]
MTNDDYSHLNTTQIAALFQVSHETVRIWCAEFERHLSPRANPGRHQKRIFTGEDMTILALIAAYKNDGLTFQDIHASLDNGERGEPPPIPDEDDIEGLIPQETGKRLVVKIQQLEEELEDAHEENERLKAQLEETQRTSLRHEVRAEMLHEQLEKIEVRMQKLLDERAQLEREIGSMQSDLRRHSSTDEP